MTDEPRLGPLRARARQAGQGFSWRADAARGLGALRSHGALAPTVVCALVLLGLGAPVSGLRAAEVAVGDGERLYLSGIGPDDPVSWEFEISSGRRAGEAAQIGVPSQWELEGFGSYAYGFHDDKPHEVGRYRRTFDVPAAWSGRGVRLVFEGVMTDATVRLNGEALAPVHRGGFTEFSYPVSGELLYGAENSIEVEVAEHSAEGSINRAERDADYWVFGGIFRPVYLEALPAVAIEHVSIDARHDGRLAVVAELGGTTAGLAAVARVLSSAGELLWEGGATVGESEITLEASVDAEPWSAESPTLHTLELALLEGGEPVHTVTRRFGFRSVELRQDGVWVNGRRVLLKGINRHSFWPDSGRTLTPEMNRRDAELIRDMNANTVRTSHYPPDRAFLDACDELGLYVIEELPGWHDAYTTEAGRPLVRELVRRDSYRPSVILWANGNEGGWNRELEPDYFEHDLQDRPVIYPDDLGDVLDTTHYLNWSELGDALDPKSWRNRWRALWGPLPAVMPTEILHGLYDGGHGAGLEDYWEAISESPRGAGLFLWTFLDEAVRRVDQQGELDAHGSYAPDGIVGPYRQPEGSYWAVRELWSPVRLRRLEDAPSGAARIEVENRFVRTDLEAVALRWSWSRIPGLGLSLPEFGVLSSGEVGVRAAPGRTATFELAPPLGSSAGLVLTIEAVDRRTGRTFVRQDFSPPLGTVAGPIGALDAGLDGALGGSGLEVEAGREIVLRSGSESEVVLDAATGALVRLDHRTRVLRVDGDRSEPGWTGANRARWRPGTVRTTTGTAPAETQVLFDDDQGFATWRVYPSGWLRLHYRLDPRVLGSPAGITLPLDPDGLRAVRWYGRGPNRVWANRLRGGRLDVWEGSPNASGYGIGPLDLGGYWSDVRWLEWRTETGTLTVVPERFDLAPGLGAEAGGGDGPFAAFSPMLEPEDPRHTFPSVAPGLSLLHSIPGVGTKFHPAEDLGPKSRPRVATERYEAVLWLRWEAPLAATAIGID